MRSFIRLYLGCALAALASASPLYSLELVSGADHPFSVLCNAHGYVLTSKEPIARYIDAGAEPYVSEEIEVLYLGKSGDALSALWGEGVWAQKNGGLLVSFESFAIGFPRQEIGCEDD